MPHFEYDKDYPFAAFITNLGKTSTGLGLSIAKELVQRLNGSITCDVQNDIFIISITFQISK